MKQTYYLLFFILILYQYVFSLAKRTKSSRVEINAFIVPQALLSPHISYDINSKFESKYSNILDSVLSQLQKSDKLSFSWNEQLYFFEWINTLSIEQKQTLMEVLQNKQLKINPTYSSSSFSEKSLFSFVSSKIPLIKRIRNDLSVSSKVSLIPFSNGYINTTTQFLQTVESESLILGDFSSATKTQFKKLQHMEFSWKGEAEAYGEIFTHVLGDSRSEAVFSDFDSPQSRAMMNTKKVAEKIVKHIREQSSIYKTSNVLIPFSTTFEHMNLEKQMVNLEKVVNHINENQKNMNVKFSNFEEYIKEVRTSFKTLSSSSKSSHLVLPSYVGDFVPVNVDDEHFSSGSFSSFMELKMQRNSIEEIFEKVLTFYPFAMAKLNAFGSRSVETLTQKKLALTLGLHKVKKKMEVVQNFDFFTSNFGSKERKEFLIFLEKVSASIHNVYHESLEVLLNQALASNRPELASFEQKLTQIAYDWGDIQPEKEWPLTFCNEKPYFETRIHHLQLPKLNYQNLLKVRIFDSIGNPVKVYLSQSMYGLLPREWEETLASLPTVSSIYFQVEVPPMGCNTYFLTFIKNRDLFVSETRNFQILENQISIVDNGKLTQAGKGKVRKENSRFEGLALGSHLTGTKYFIFETQSLKVEIDISSGMLHSIEIKSLTKRFLVRQKYTVFGSDEASKLILKGVRSGYTYKIGARYLLSEIQSELFTKISIIGNKFRQDFSLEGEKVKVEVYIPGLQRNTDFMLQLDSSIDSKKDFYISNPVSEWVLKTFSEDIPPEGNFLPSHSIAIQSKTKKNKSDKETMKLSLQQVASVSSFGTGKVYAILRRSYPLENEEPSEIEILSHAFNFEISFSKVTSLAQLSSTLMELPLQTLFSFFPKSNSHQRREAKFIEIFKPKYSLLKENTESKALIHVIDVEKSGTLDFIANPAGINFLKSNPLDDGFVFLNGYIARESGSLVDEVSALAEDDVIICSLTLLFNPPGTKSLLPDLTPKVDQEKSSPELPNKKQKERNNKVPIVSSDDPNEIKKQLLIEEIKTSQAFSTVLRSKLRRIQVNLDTLKDDLSVLKSTSNTQAIEYTLNEIAKLQMDLDAATEQLGESLLKERNAQASLELVELRLNAFDIENKNYYSRSRMSTWETNLHGLITGAGGMLVMILLYNLMCLKLNKLPRVPIKWVGFKDEKQALPTYKGK
eukprot:snap_masked-scaffold_2-processed-gene-0.21-mRNA-1 protein AED:1.00 eAED:1.00 QI:0/-1/0/0/-1/1/1/0/1188